MANITIVDLEVFWRVGVSDEERAKPQRLLLTVDMVLDFSAAAVSDRVSKTIDHMEVVKMLLEFGNGQKWCLVEKLASDIGNRVFTKFSPQAVMVEVKKFNVPQARHISFTWSRERG